MVTDFMKEATIMKALDGDARIVRLLGICKRFAFLLILTDAYSIDGLSSPIDTCFADEMVILIFWLTMLPFEGTDKMPYLMLMEFMEHGDLKSTLRKNRAKKKTPSRFSTKDLVVMGIDVAEGMAYLASKKIVHRDLAARNCMVDADYRCNVGDFGLTRDVYQQEYYRMTGSSPLPIRWMAPEALEDGVSTSSSDIWSFGVVLWEIQTFAKLPYGMMSNTEVFEKVSEEEYRLPLPKQCPSEVYDVMLKCWAADPDDRPDFNAAAALLTEVLKCQSITTEPLKHHGAVVADAAASKPAASAEVAPSPSMYVAPQASVDTDDSDGEAPPIDGGYLAPGSLGDPASLGDPGNTDSMKSGSSAIGTYYETTERGSKSNITP